MKKSLILGSIPMLFTASAFAGTYVTGNVQLHSDDLHGSSATSTIEAGHTFTNEIGGLTAYSEIDGIQLGELKGTEVAYPAFLTVGVEQSYSISPNLWVAAGYQHLLSQGDSIQYRPLIKIGYNFENGVAISNRTRAHIDATDSDSDTDFRMDNRVAYSPSEALSLSYNNVYMIDASVMDHELRATWTRAGVQPYFEFRNQADNENNAFVFGATYAW
ncbi:porin [Vibrio sp. D431a]|uniref:porin n=1 Tax=Vibrio sp. D431a TaxID=2837388 RepID=UPI00255238CC|nr:porin [Vibrio sp. D431a]MDK9789954.1 porin [Vibrio sp. D431a]